MALSGEQAFSSAQTQVFSPDGRKPCVHRSEQIDGGGACHDLGCQRYGNRSGFYRPALRCESISSPNFRSFFRLKRALRMYPRRSALFVSEKCDRRGRVPLRARADLPVREIRAAAVCCPDWYVNRRPHGKGT